MRFDLLFSTFHFFSLSETGPWELVLEWTLDDSRQQNDPLPLQTFNFNSVTARYAKFKLLSHWGSGGGLQYFKIKKAGIKIYKKKIKHYCVEDAFMKRDC